MSKEATTAPGARGARGITYETRMCILCFVRGYFRNPTSFKLEYQVTEAGKFDDVVFYDGKKYQIMQLKHKEDQNSDLKIKHSHFFNEKFNSDYNLIKYVESLIDVATNKKFKDKIKMAVLITNIDFDSDIDNKLSLVMKQCPSAKGWYDGLKSIELIPSTLDGSDIFDTSKLFPTAKYYKFNDNPNIVQILHRQAKTLAEEIRQNPKWKKCNKKDQQDQLKQQEETFIKNLENMTESEIETALKDIVYAVNQPNEMELEEIIKNELNDHFKLQNTDTIFNALEKLFRGWCETNAPLDQPSTSCQTSIPHIQREISFKDADELFQKNLKKVSFGVTSPTSSFTGRVDVLDAIREKLKENHNLIVSQTVAISGLGGIGKTQITKQFINKFGQSDFYGRVIWIEAESDESVKKSFELLAEKLNIEDRTNKAITTLIDDVFEHFHGFKVLFVFDNFDKTPESSKENLVVYCRKRASDSTKDYRPYLIFTSRNRECVPGVTPLNVGVLTKEDAKDFIVKGLADIIFTEQDAEKLAEILQYFPLALQQAIAYINRQYKIKKESGGKYDIKAYLIKFNEEKKKLLDYKFSDDFGDFGKTTFVTWNVTLEAIKKDEINGPNAIRVLQLMSYLYADKIDAKMFLSHFENDSTCLGEAFLLLKKYSMIAKIEEDGTFYQIHRLVQAVMQLQFKENEKEILRQAIKLVHPELYDCYFEKNRDWSHLVDLMEKCTFDQYLHYNNLLTYIQTNEKMNEEFRRFFRDLHDRLLIAAVLKDDLQSVKIITPNMSKEDFMEFIKTNTVSIMVCNSTEVIKYLIENGYLRLSDSGIEQSMHSTNLDLFKYLVEKGADLSKLKLVVSTQIISDIKNGKSDSLQTIISLRSIMSFKILQKSKMRFEILRESLFFATLFNQESIVKLLIGNKVNLDYKLELRRCGTCWTPILVAAKLRHTNILVILLNCYDKFEVQNNLFKLLRDKSFFDKNHFEIIFNRYLELGGDINDQDNYGRNFICAVNVYTNIVAKKEIVKFLLDNGADPSLTDRFGENALVNILEQLKSDKYLNTDNRSKLEDIYNKMTSKISHQKFITGIRDSLFIKICKVYYDDSKKLCDILLKEIDDKNVRNDKGETLLIHYLTGDLRRYNNESPPLIDIIKFIVEAGVDVEEKDNYGENALYYALELKRNDIFTYLQSKVRSVYEETFKEAIIREQLAIVKALIPRQFSKDHRFKDGKTPLSTATEWVCKEVASFLNELVKT